MNNRKITTKIILEALRRRHSSGEDVGAEKYAFFEELRYATGGAGWREALAIDAWAMATWPSLDFATYSFEVKASRSDFLKELRNSEKKKPAMAISNYFFFVTGLDIAQASEIPEGCGLMVAGWNDGEVKLLTKVKAPLRKAVPFSERFVASILRRAARAERFTREERPKLRDALEFYAKQDNWIDEEGNSPIIDDVGKIAREARGDPPAEGDELEKRGLYKTTGGQDASAHE